MSSRMNANEMGMMLSKNFDVTRDDFFLLCDELINEHKRAVTIEDLHQRKVLTLAIEYISTCFGVEHIEVATKIEFMEGKHGGLNETCVAERDLGLKNHVFIQFGSRSVYIGLNPHHA